MKFSNEEYLLTGGNLDLKEAKRGFIVSIFNNPIKIFETMKENQLKGSESLLLVRKQLASCYSVAANVMECFDLTRVVQIYLPACSQEQYEALMKDIGDDVICIYPLKRGSRMMIFCEYMTDFNDEQCMFMYQTVLDMVFAKEDGRMTMPYHVRVYEYTNYAEGL